MMVVLDLRIKKKTTMIKDIYYDIEECTTPRQSSSVYLKIILTRVDIEGGDDKIII